jgi:hypothetical protein
MGGRRDRIDLNDLQGEAGVGTDIGKLIEELQSLNTEELRRLRRALDERLSPPSTSPASGPPEEEYKRRPVAAGVLSEIRPPVADPGPYRGRATVPVPGKPVSETIIEERR